MSRLGELQSQFQSFLLGQGAGIERSIVSTETASGDERLAVYADAYRLRLLEVLTEDFPGVKGMLGAEAFEALGRAYIGAHPSTHPSVRWFGRHLARFLREAPAYHGRPALAEMAAFEWAQGEVIDAADSPTVSVDELAALPPASWPEMRIVFQRALRRLDLAWTVPAVWRAIDEGKPPPALERADPPLPWLFWRREMEVHWRSLDDDERFALDAALAGSAFGAICEGLFERRGDADVPLRAAGFLKQWATDSLIAHIEK